MVKKINSNLGIFLFNNVFNHYLYDNGRGTVIDLDEHGDEEEITFGELKTFASGRDKRALQKMYVVISGAEGNEEELDEILKQLKLDTYYDKAKKLLRSEKIDETTFSEFVLNCTVRELEDALKDNDLFSVLSDTIVYLFREKEIGTDKITPLLDIMGIEYYEYLQDLDYK